MPLLSVTAIGDWFAAHSGDLLAGLLNILIVIAIALVLRALAGRVIDQVAKRLVTSQSRINEAKAKMPSRVVRHSSASRAERQKQRAKTIASVLKSVATIVIFSIAFVTILGQLGINIGPILASAGVVGLAIGFGAQSLVQDYLAGIFMMSEDQYGVGDTVNVGEAVGTVEGVTLRTTKIRDLSGGLWHIRNGEIRRVCNMNQDWANAVIELPLDYSVDLERATEVIQQTIDTFADDADVASRILERPEINGVIDIGGGAMTVQIMVKTEPGEQWALGRKLRARLKQSLDRAGVPVAHPAFVRPSTTVGAQD